MCVVEYVSVRWFVAGVEHTASDEEITRSDRAKSDADDNSDGRIKTTLPIAILEIECATVRFGCLLVVVHRRRVATPNY